MSKILLATYTIKLRDKKSKDYYSLDDLNGLDFFGLFKTFLEKLGTKPTTLSDEESKAVKKTLKLGNDLELEPSKRVMSGRFESGLSGKNLQIVNVETNEVVHNMTKEEAPMQPTFFYIEIPEGSKNAYLILQKESSVGGIKGLFYHSFQSFLRDSEYSFFLEFNNLLLPKVLEGMLKHGNVNTVTFVNKKTPSELDDIVDKGMDTKSFQVGSKTVLKTSSGLPVKDFIRKVFFPRIANNVSEVDASLDDKYHEISFTIKEGTREKTYYTKKRNKTLPDLDITNRLEFKNSMPEINSLRKIAKEEIEAMKKALKL